MPSYLKRVVLLLPNISTSQVRVPSNRTHYLGVECDLMRMDLQLIDTRRIMEMNFRKRNGRNTLISRSAAGTYDGKTRRLKGWCWTVNGKSVRVLPLMHSARRKGKKGRGRYMNNISKTIKGINVLQYCTECILICANRFFSTWAVQVLQQSAQFRRIWPFWHTK